MAGEEIESKYLNISSDCQTKLTNNADPFGYDKNDLNLDHFTHNIIRKFFSPPQAISFPPSSTYTSESNTRDHAYTHLFLQEMN